MKTVKILLPLIVTLVMSCSAHAYILWEEATNLPYTNGCIEGQGSWYAYTGTNKDAFTTNGILYLNITNKDEVAVPTNSLSPPGWATLNNGEFTFASFRLEVNALPTLTGDYFAQFQNNKDTNDLCHVFIDALGTNVPGTFRLGIANYDTSFANLTPPNNYPMDLATGVWYNVTILYDTNFNEYPPTYVGATLWVNPSLQDWTNLVKAAGYGGEGFVFGADTTESSTLLGMTISQIGFSPYLTGGISNVIVGTTINDVITTNLPVFGITPQSGTNYAGNSATFYAVASAVDAQYQWFDTDTGEPLSDSGGAYIGSQSNTLIVTSLSTSDTYYCVVTDAYGNTATSPSALETVITTPTPVFFTNEPPVTNTDYEYTTAALNNPASGTGPISYQWYFAPATTPNAYSALSGQNSPNLSLYLDSTNYAGNYYVQASSSATSSSANGPTNTLIELNAMILTNLLQLKNMVPSNVFASALTTTVGIFTNVLVTGYVANFIGFGSSYTEYYIVDSTGQGVQVYLQNATDNLGNDNMPPIGSCVQVIGVLEVYDGELEIAPSSPSAATVISNAPPLVISPTLANSYFNTLATNGLSLTAQSFNGSLITFTNVYLYDNRLGKGISSDDGGIFYSNSYTTAYFTVGSPYNPTNSSGGPSNPAFPVNTNTLEIYQYGYDHPHTGLNPFDYRAIPTNCFQLTGFFSDYKGTAGELEPTRPADYVTNAPPHAILGIAVTNGLGNVLWSPQVGSTYTVHGSTNVSGPYPQLATGLAYYPTNGLYPDTNAAPAKFYNVSSP